MRAISGRVWLFAIIYKYIILNKKYTVSEDKLHFENSNL